jgi:beta-lactamase class A
MAKITKILILTFLLTLRSTEGSTPPVSLNWPAKLKTETARLLKNSDGNFGIYIKSLSTGEEFSHHGTRPWYLASAIKVAVANELYHQIEDGKISFGDRYIIALGDYRDGAGKTNFVKPGSAVSIRQLTEQMLIESDNAATDILIKRLGIDNVNNRLQAIVPNGFSPISSLLDVRRLAYSEFNLKAMDLDNLDFLALKRQRSEMRKIRWLSKKLKIKPSELSVKTLREAFENYYSTELNSGTLTAYADLLAYSSKNSDLISIMSRAATGDKRISKGLPKGFAFAHKTGTQLARICDMGIVYKNNPQKGLIVTVCAEKFKSSANAENVFREIAKAITASGALENIE